MFTPAQAEAYVKAYDIAVENPGTHPVVALGSLFGAKYDGILETNHLDVAIEVLEYDVGYWIHILSLLTEYVERRVRYNVVFVAYFQVLKGILDPMRIGLDRRPVIHHCIDNGVPFDEVNQLPLRVVGSRLEVKR